MQSLTRFRVPDLNEGLSYNDSNITPTFTLDQETINFGMGAYSGLSPRYGMQPLPGHNSIDAGAIKGGLHQSTSNSGSIVTLKNREKSYGVFNVTLRDVNSDGTFGSGSSTHYLTMQYSLGQLSYSMLTDAPALDGDFFSQRRVPTIRAYVQASQDTSTRSFFLNDMISSGFDLLSSPNYVKTTTYTGQGKNIPCNWLAFIASTAGSASLPPSGQTKGQFGTFKFHEFADGQKTARKLTIWSLGRQGSTNTLNLRKYEYQNYDFTTAYPYLPNKQYAKDIATPQFSTIETPSKVTNNGWLFPITADAKFLLVNDNGLSTTSTYTAVFSASKGSFAAVIFDHILSAGSFLTENDSTLITGLPNKEIVYLNPKNGLAKPPEKITFDMLTFGSSYKEDGFSKSTCWYSWPTFSSTTALVTSPVTPTPGNQQPVALGAANSGTLRKNTTYEFAYSIFDKLLGAEGNVGLPARVRTGSDDNVAISISQNMYDTPVNMQSCQVTTYTNKLAITTKEFNNAEPRRLNTIEYRIYYRELGTNEWLPALFIDAAKYHYYAEYDAVWMCAQPIPGLPGPKPGGYQDSSPLPEDTYFDVCNYRNVIFWCSEKSINYSGRNEPFSYPILNAIPCPKGQFRGIIPHAFPGQAEQDSRLVIFGSEETYVGRFRGQGNGQTMTVRVSPTAVGTFERPGSDFIVDTWTNITAFSSRAAVSADGILYYWGDSGIYRDTGRDLPEKQFSRHLEPWLFGIYDNNKTELTHAVYNARTKEILWFFRPKDTTTHKQMCLVYSLLHDSFYHWGFGQNVVVDWSQTTNIKSNAAENQDGSGLRVLLGIRSSEAAGINEVVTFDDLNKSGDFPSNSFQLNVKQIADGGDSWILSLTDKISGDVTLGTQTDTFLTIANFKYFTNRSENVDGIYKIKTNTESTITIYKGAGTAAALPVVSLTGLYHFPIHVQAVTGFPLVLKSDYWEPAGEQVWFRWLMMHHRYTVDLHKTSYPDAHKFSYKFYTLLGADQAERTCTLSDNAKGNCIIYSQIPINKQNTDGGALSIRISPVSGTWNGGNFNLNMLAFDVQTQSAAQNNVWEG